MTRKHHQPRRLRNRSSTSNSEATSTKPVPGGTEIPSSEVDTEDHYTRQHHQYPRKYPYILALSTNNAIWHSSGFELRSSGFQVVAFSIELSSPDVVCTACYHSLTLTSFTFNLAHFLGSQLFEIKVIFSNFTAFGVTGVVAVIHCSETYSISLIYLIFHHIDHILIHRMAICPHPTHQVC